MTKICDNKSVGVIVQRGDEIALLKRAKFPIAYALPAGHIDDHGSPEQAAIDEVYEEVGLRILVSNLGKTAIAGRRVENPCRRTGGDHHVWWVYTVDDVNGEIVPSADETQGAGWYSREQLQTLADRTAAYLGGTVTEQEWQNEPGLERVWLGFLQELGYLK